MAARHRQQAKATQKTKNEQPKQKTNQAATAELLQRWINGNRNTR